MIQGIDISNCQSVINWQKVAASGQVNFAICKATEGPKYTDSEFKNNWNGIKNVGLLRGAYHFAYASQDPIIQADHFVSTVGQLDPTDTLTLDLENSSITGHQFTDWALSWLERVESLTGCIPILYTGGPFFNSHDGNPDADTIQRLLRFPLWLACYVQNPEIYVPEIWKNAGLSWTIWQRSGNFAAHGDTPLYVPGIPTVVDRDIFRGSLEEMVAFALNLHSAQSNSTSTSVDILTGALDSDQS